VLAQNLFLRFLPLVGFIAALAVNNNVERVIADTVEQ
jgi:hypothetical protein